MPNSRVYIDVKKAGEHVQITMKNVSATELNFDPEEITERFEMCIRDRYEEES